MGRRSGIPDTDEALAQLSLAEIEAEIGRIEIRQSIPNRTAYLRKANEKRLIWLKKARAHRLDAEVDE